MLDAGTLAFVRNTLPPPPARVLEVGAGDGELTRVLAGAGYDMVAVDPASQSPSVRPISLHELNAPAGSFDCAVAVLSMHHVEPLDESCARLAEVVRSGGTLVLDEIDFERFDERAAAWWLEHHGGGTDGHGQTPAEIVAHHQAHCHILTRLEDALGEWFELTPPARAPYLYRWDLAPELRDAEVELIAQGELPATGARLVGIRKPTATRRGLDPGPPG
jgi:SAM-dependent methyltransferase